MSVGGADIQIENGDWVRIHHDILERLATSPLNGREYRCLLFLLRKTYGYNKKEDKISLSQWEEGTGIKRHHVLSVLRGLEAKRIIYCKSPGNNRTMTYGFNKYWETWQFDDVNDDDDETVTVGGNSLSVPQEGNSCEQTVPVEGNKTVPEFGNNKRQKTSSLLASDDSDDAMALVRQAYEAVARIGPPMREEDGRVNLMLATQLIDTYGYSACVRGISTLKERNDSMLKKQGRRGISAPLPYLQTIMEYDFDPLMTKAATVDFAVEDLAI